MAKMKKPTDTIPIWPEATYRQWIAQAEHQPGFARKEQVERYQAALRKILLMKEQGTWQEPGPVGLGYPRKAVREEHAPVVVSDELVKGAVVAVPGF
jgi:hypothetical protein